MLIGSSLELLGISAVYPFIQMMVNPETFKDGPFYDVVCSIFPNINEIEILLAIGVIFIIIYITKNVFLVYSAYVQGKVSASIQRELSTTMLKSYLKRPYEYFLNMNSSDVVTCINIDILAVYNILNALLQMIAEMFTIVLIAFYLVWLDYTIAIAALMLMASCFFAVTIGFKKKIKIAGRENRKATRDQNKITIQAISGIKDIIVTGRKDNFSNMFDEQAKVKERTAIAESMITAWPDRILEGVCISGFMGIVCVKLVFGADMDAFIPIMGNFAMGAFKLLPSVAKVSSRISSIVFKLPSLSKCYENIEQVKKDDAIYTDSLSIDAEIEDDGTILLEKEIRVENISWHYKNATKNIITDQSFSIKKGESIAFIGASGMGKTTVADIVLGLLKPQSGKVLMDGRDISNIPISWSKNIGYVPQSVFLLDDTVRINVAFGIPYNEIDDEKIWNALKQAQLDSFIRELPDGLDTIVGERGVKFSGGQRQRIAIARALYVDPEILVLDEATSALDNETENAVMESVENLQGKKTLIIIAHRLTTIRKCDRVYEVNNAKINEIAMEDIL